MTSYQHLFTKNVCHCSDFNVGDNYGSLKLLIEILLDDGVAANAGVANYHHGS